MALEADQLGAHDPRNGACHLGLSDTRLTLEEQRSVHSQRQEQRGGEPVIGDVAGRGQRRGHICGRFQLSQVDVRLR